MVVTGGWYIRSQRLSVSVEFIGDHKRVRRVGGALKRSLEDNGLSSHRLFELALQLPRGWTRKWGGNWSAEGWCNFYIYFLFLFLELYTLCLAKFASWLDGGGGVQAYSSITVNTRLIPPGPGGLPFGEQIVDYRTLTLLRQTTKHKNTLERFTLVFLASG
jgi:hypothetical protein